MSEIIEKYDPIKIERIKRILEDQKTDGELIFFETFLDNLRIVRKTDDLSRFDRYKDYIDDNTRELKIIIYSSAAARNNKSYTYALKEEKNLVSSERTLGEVDIDSKISQRVSLERERWDAEETKKKLAEKDAKLLEAEEYIETLQETIAKLKEESSANNGMNGFTSLVKDLAPQLIGLALKEEPVALSGAESRTEEATFKKKEENTQPQGLSERDKKQLEILGGWKKAFTADEFSKLDIIIKHLAEQKESIDLVIESFETNNSTNQ